MKKALHCHEKTDPQQPVNSAVVTRNVALHLMQNAQHVSKNSENQSQSGLEPPISPVSEKLGWLCRFHLPASAVRAGHFRAGGNPVTAPSFPRTWETSTTLNAPQRKTAQSAFRKPRPVISSVLCISRFKNAHTRHFKVSGTVPTLCCRICFSYSCSVLAGGRCS